MLGISEPALRFRELARSGALFPSAARRPLVEVPASAVVQRDIALASGDRFVDLTKRAQEWQLAVVLLVDRLGLALRLADHERELAHSGAIYFGEVDMLRVLAIKA